MKFAHELKEALRREGFPPHWVESAVPYGLLKKSIKKVEAELKSLGLDAKTLRRLIPPSSSSEAQETHRSSGDIAVGFQYQFGNAPAAFRPTFTLYVQLEDGVAIDASLSPDTKQYLLSLADKQRRFVGSSPSLEQKYEGNDSYDLPLMKTPTVAISPSLNKQGGPVIQQIEVPLTFDAEFFEILQGDVLTLGTLHTKEQKIMTENISSLGKEVAKVTNPNKYNKSDLDRWRELFDIYLQAGIFFSTNELDHGSRNSAVALKQLQWFQAEVLRRDLVKSFKLPASREALKMFININVMLLRNIKFQEINQVAISKILKKFDKHTSLGARNAFLPLAQSDKIMSEEMAKAVCSEMSREIVRVVPQLDDYLCPICFSISYKPVRLTCGHIFCIRCMIKMQKSHDKHCPLCRNDVIMDADSANIDESLMHFLQKYFPRETKAKQKENEIAVGVDLYGESYANAKCNVM